MEIEIGEIIQIDHFRVVKTHKNLSSSFVLTVVNEESEEP